MRELTASAVAVTATTPSYDTILEVADAGGGHEIMTLQITNLLAAASLTDFRMAVKSNPDSTYQVLVPGADWTAGTNDTVLFCSSTNPQTLAASGSAQVKVNIKGWGAVKFEGMVAAGTATITVEGWMQ